MVNQKDKKTAVRHLTNLLENSNLYTILTNSNFSVKVQEKTRTNGPVRTIDTIIANFQGTTNELKSHLNQNRRNQVYTATIFYNDHSTAFVRMVQHEAARIDKSFKLYTVPQIRSIISLRDKEKEMVKHYSTKELTYLTPLAVASTGTIEIIRLNPINLDYSHIKPGDTGYGFVQNREAIDYKLPETINHISNAIQFRFYPNDPLYRAIIAAKITP